VSQVGYAPDGHNHTQNFAMVIITPKTTLNGKVLPGDPIILARTKIVPYTKYKI